MHCPEATNKGEIFERTRPYRTSAVFNFITDYFNFLITLIISSDRACLICLQTGTWKSCLIFLLACLILLINLGDANIG